MQFVFAEFISYICNLVVAAIFILKVCALDSAYREHIWLSKLKLIKQIILLSELFYYEKEN